MKFFKKFRKDEQKNTISSESPHTPSGELLQIKSERDQYQAILEGMSEGLLLLSTSGKVLMANPSFYQMFALERRCEGQTLMEVIRHHEILDLFSKTIKTKNTEEIEITLHQGKSEKNISIHLTPLEGIQGPKKLIMVFFDITQRRLLENAKQEFVANVSHELRTPLTSIRGYTETLRQGAWQDPKASLRFLRKIEKNAIQLQNLIEDLLKLSQVESGRVNFELYAFSLQKTFSEISREFAEALKQKSLKLTIELKKDVQVWAQGAALKQVLSNLVSNAIKYTPDQGQIYLSAETTNGFAKIMVRDTGLGIPTEDLPRIFERFYRVDKARSRDMGGTGLGLAIVKHLVQAQGGEVGVISQPQKGSEFFFTLAKVE